MSLKISHIRNKKRKSNIKSVNLYIMQVKESEYEKAREWKKVQEHVTAVESTEKVRQMEK